MTLPTLSVKTIALGIALAYVGHAWAQTPADVPSNAKKGTITPVSQPPAQPTVKPQVQTSTLPKNTKTWDDKRYQRKTVTGVTSPAPAPVHSPKPAETKSKSKSKSKSKPGHCPPGLAKKNNGCLPPGHAK